MAPEMSEFLDWLPLPMILTLCFFLKSFFLDFKRIHFKIKDEYLCNSFHWFGFEGLHIINRHFLCHRFCVTVWPCHVDHVSQCTTKCHNSNGRFSFELHKNSVKRFTAQFNSLILVRCNIVTSFTDSVINISVTKYVTENPKLSQLVQE